jgi:hypothetical protein
MSNAPLNARSDAILNARGDRSRVRGSALALRRSGTQQRPPRAPSRRIQEIRPPEAGRVSIIPRPSLG